MAKKDKAVKTSLTEEDYVKLIEYCERNDETVSYVLRKAIKDFLKEE